jgi:DNA-binding CsgD family transcriptional regulator
MTWWVVIAGLMGAVVTLRVYSGLLCFSMARRPDFPPVTKQLCWALTAIQVASLISFLGRFSSHWQNREEWQSAPLGGFFLAGQLLSLSVAAAGILVVLWLVKRVLHSIGTSERLARVMVQSPLHDERVSELALTARELEVMKAMAEGSISDQQIGDLLGIAPNTAATHVRNILRKAGVHDRRDLLLLYKFDQQRHQDLGE